MTDLDENYIQDTEQCLEVLHKIQSVVPHKPSWFQLDSWKKAVLVEDLTRKDVHALCKALNTTLTFQEGCGGKKRVHGMVGALEIVGTTDIPCPSCQERMKKQRQAKGVVGLLRSIRFLLVRSNMQATLFHSIRLRRFLWVGRGWNPSYTLVCAQSTCGTITDCEAKNAACIITADCKFTGCSYEGSCGCQAPLPNSTQFSGCTATCASTGACGNCVSKKCAVATCGVTSCPTGTCGYDCDAGYTWNGSACVIVATGQQLFTLINQEDY